MTDTTHLPLEFRFFVRLSRFGTNTLGQLRWGFLSRCNLLLATTQLHSSRKHNRNGITLLETLIATVILLVSIAALGTQSAVGVRAARRVQAESMSALLCHSVLDELMVTGQVKSTTAPKAIEGHPGWQYTSEISELATTTAHRGPVSSDRLCIMTVTTWRTGVWAIESKTSLTQVVRKPFKTVVDLESGAEAVLEGEI
jgi:Tfp pilus assembly protein PilV